MQINKINGNTYYIPAPTNIGVFQFKDKYTLLIDSGDNNQQARKIAETVQSQGLNIKYLFSTHHHIDHSGGLSFLQENFPGSLLYAGRDEALFLENSRLFPMYLYGGHPPRELSRIFVTSKQVRLDEGLKSGVCRINEEKFDIISLPGHSPGQVGIGTRDQVCFLGDALFSREIIAKYSLPFLFDIEAQRKTYQTIRELPYEWYVIGHAEQIYTRDEIQLLVDFNQDNLCFYLDLIVDVLAQPHTREELLEEISILQDLQFDFKEYFFSLATVGAMVAYLLSAGRLSYQLENGKLYFYNQ